MHCVKYARTRVFSEPFFSCIIYDSVFIRENTDKRKEEFWHISRSNGLMLSQAWSCCFDMMCRGVFRTLSEKTPMMDFFFPTKAVNSF